MHPGLFGAAAEIMLSLSLSFRYSHLNVSALKAEPRPSCLPATSQSSLITHHCFQISSHMPTHSLCPTVFSRTLPSRISPLALSASYLSVGSFDEFSAKMRVIVPQKVFIPANDRSLANGPVACVCTSACRLFRSPSTTKKRGENRSVTVRG